jgi:hypothetical protein
MYSIERRSRREVKDSFLDSVIGMNEEMAG